MKKIILYFFIICSFKSFCSSKLHKKCGHILLSEIIYNEGKNHYSEDIKNLILKWIYNNNKNENMQIKIMNLLNLNLSCLEDLKQYKDQNFKGLYGSLHLLRNINNEKITTLWNQCISQNNKKDDINYFIEEKDGHLLINYTFNKKLSPFLEKVDIVLDNLEFVEKQGEVPKVYDINHKYTRHFKIGDTSKEASFLLTLESNLGDIVDFKINIPVAFINYLNLINDSLLNEVENSSVVTRASSINKSKVDSLDEDSTSLDYEFLSDGLSINSIHDNDSIIENILDIDESYNPIDDIDLDLDSFDLNKKRYYKKI